MGQFASSQKCTSRKRYNSPKPVSSFRRVVPRVPLIIRDLQAKMKIEKKENTTDSMFEYLKGNPECKIRTVKNNVHTSQTENERETSCCNSEAHTEILNPCKMLHINSFSRNKETASPVIKSLLLQKTKPISEQLSPKHISNYSIWRMKSPSIVSKSSQFQFSFQAGHISPKASSMLKPHSPGAERSHRRIISHSSQTKVKMSGYIEPKLKPSSKNPNQFSKLKYVISRSKCITSNKHL